MWCITYCEGWGGRFPRTYHKFYTTRKPPNKEVIEILNKRMPNLRATLDWFKPCNSGLISVVAIKTEF